MGSVGDDEHGRAYSDNLARLQVDTRHLATVAGVSTGIATIFVESGSGENMIVIVPGANARLTAAHVTAAEADIAAAGCVVATLELGLAAVTAAMQLGRKVIVILASDWSLTAILTCDWPARRHHHPERGPGAGGPRAGAAGQRGHPRGQRDGGRAAGGGGGGGALRRG